MDERIDKLLVNLSDTEREQLDDVNLKKEQVNF
jgi:hypothetical protein